MWWWWWWWGSSPSEARAGPREGLGAAELTGDDADDTDDWPPVLIIELRGVLCVVASDRIDRRVSLGAAAVAAVAAVAAGDGGDGGAG